jgi:Double zinc ribbon
MGNPASRSGLMRTCPACNGAVEPGYKFCKVCGTPIPELLTCSKCGTQFTHPDKFCDLCGAPLIQEKIPPPPDEERPEHYNDEIPEPDTGEIQVQEIEEIQEPPEEERPEHYDDEIPEPDTDQLLEQYGKEYDDDETLESYHKPKPISPKHIEAKKPVTYPALHGQESSGFVDDVLFLPDKEPVNTKPPVNKIRIIGGGIVLVTILAAVFFIGLPMIPGNGGFSTHSNATASEITPAPEPAITMTTLPTLAAPPYRAFVPLPTQLVPTDKKVYFQVQKNPITAKISVIFTGSAGVGSISSADIKVTHPDGSVATGIILPLKGVTDITLDGSKDTDRVEIIAKMYSGETYRVYDDLVPFIRN